jgi:hypothetical protein
MKSAFVYAPDVTLKASVSAGFGTAFSWENATPVPGSPHLAKVSRRNPGFFPVRIKDRAGKVAAELNVWVVWSTINATDATAAETGPVGDRTDPTLGSGFLIRMGYNFVHAIQPASMITTADHPDFTTGTPAAAPVAGGVNYAGESLSGGVNSKWDSSRIIRRKTLNPAGVSLPGNASFHGTFPEFPSMLDGDGHSGGADAISFQDWLVVGNDDSGTTDEDNNPYDARVAAVLIGPGSSATGQLTGYDAPSRFLLHSAGSNGDSVEWRMHFQEFTRLDINGKWYLISDHFPWRVHYKVKKTSGKWRDNGSVKAKDNVGF